MILDSFGVVYFLVHPQIFKKRYEYVMMTSGSSTGERDINFVVEVYQ